MHKLALSVGQKVMSVAGLAALASPIIVPLQAVQAQAWIGEFAGRLAADAARHRCMMGEMPKPAKVEAARAEAIKLMTGYWTEVRSGGAANVAAVFDGSRKARWVYGSTTKAGADLATVADPLVNKGRFEPSPESFAKGSGAAKARGVWRVRDASGSAGGSYVADFVWSQGLLKLRTLTLLPAGAEPPVATQFCNEPGDVEPYRVRMEEMERERAAKRAAKERRRAEQAAKRK